VLWRWPVGLLYQKERKKRKHPTSTKPSVIPYHSTPLCNVGGGSWA
jgi:hypothetical protein